MKKVAFRTAPAKRSIPAHRKSGGGGVVVHDRHGHVIRRAAKVAATGIKNAVPMRYDAEDIEEANQIGAALRRQHAL